ncbi:MAG: glycosyltransferase family 4 protein [Gemmatimonadetes bacterium]|nr:glycosyltransferase family 4 protein [Gemmatimonadota bacterium]
MHPSSASAREGEGPLRILVVNWLDRENPQAGGAEAHLHEVFGRMAGWGHEVSILCSGFPGSAPRTRLDGMDVHRAGGRHSFAFRARRYFRRHLADAGFDVVVEDLNKIPLFTPTWGGPPTVLLVHHLFGSTAFHEASVPVAALTWLLERPVPRVFRGSPVIAVSRSTAEDLEERGVERSRIAVIPNGVDTAHYTPGEERFEVPTLLYLGRLKKYKRVDLPILAMARLRERRVDGRLVIAGKGDHRPDLERLVHRLGLGGRVSFRGFVEEDEKLELFRRSWIHVLTSPKEGWGIANLEAAACGTATVASDAPGLRDSVVDGETGFLVPHGDVDLLADRIETLLTDPAARDAMGRRARAFAEGFSWDTAARRVLEVLRTRVVAASGPD